MVRWLKRMKIIAKEIEEGIIPDPSTLDPITGEPLPAMEGEGDPAGAMADMAGAAADINGAAGAVPTDPAPPKLPKSGEGDI